MNGENKKPSATSDKNKPKQKRKEKKNTRNTTSEDIKGLRINKN